MLSKSKYLVFITTLVLFSGISRGDPNDGDCESSSDPPAELEASRANTHNALRGKGLEQFITCPTIGQLIKISLTPPKDKVLVVQDGRYAKSQLQTFIKGLHDEPAVDVVEAMFPGIYTWGAPLESACHTRQQDFWLNLCTAIARSAEGKVLLYMPDAPEEGKGCFQGFDNVVKMAEARREKVEKEGEKVEGGRGEVKFTELAVVYTKAGHQVQLWPPFKVEGPGLGQFVRKRICPKTTEQLLEARHVTELKGRVLMRVKSISDVNARVRARSIRGPSIKYGNELVFTDFIEHYHALEQICKNQKVEDFWYRLSVAIASTVVGEIVIYSPKGPTDGTWEAVKKVLKEDMQGGKRLNRVSIIRDGDEKERELWPVVEKKLKAR